MSILIITYCMHQHVSSMLMFAGGGADYFMSCVLDCKLSQAYIKVIESYILFFIKYVKKSNRINATMDNRSVRI